MEIINLYRYHSDSIATLGILKLHKNHDPIYTLELPWLDNKPDVSCIPTGVYSVIPYSSEKYPNVYEISLVEYRSNILMHIGNYSKDTKGCILVGQGIIPGTPMITNSRLAMENIRAILGKERFILKVRDL
jgi:hypothetical protein